MPYNTTAIPPRKEPTGQAQLPLARVKKIIALDAEISMCSTHAAFVMTLAAEMFIQFLAEHGHRVAKSERKPRRNIQYADIANAIQRLGKTEFLTDVVPRTIPYKRIVERKAREKAANAAAEAAATAATQSTSENGGGGAPIINDADSGNVHDGNTIINGGTFEINGNVTTTEIRGGATDYEVNGNVGGGNVTTGRVRAVEDDDDDDDDVLEDQDPNAQLEREIRARSERGGEGVNGVGYGHVNGDGDEDGHEDQDEDGDSDVEMAG